MSNFALNYNLKIEKVCIMKKYYIQEVRQKGKEFYVLVADPRVIVKLLIRVDAGATQENQRPWEEKRVKEIAGFVAGKFKENDSVEAKGLIPNAPILNIRDVITIQKDTNGTYIELPETDDEFEEYVDTIEAIDGQHRLRAFMDDYIDPTFSDGIEYNMIFSLFYQMSKQEKKEIFMVTNEKQKEVPKNLLRFIKKDLGLLKDDEEIYDLVVGLNEEDGSPLKGRIEIGAEKLAPRGYAENQLSKIINNSNTYKVLHAQKKHDNDTMIKLISAYLNAWETVYKVKFRKPGKDTVTKIAGLRYIFYLFQTCLEILIDTRSKNPLEDFEKYIRLLPDATKIADVFTDPATSLTFRGEGATVKLARDHAVQLKAYVQSNQDDFDITAGL